jgi:hypothetical protein
VADQVAPAGDPVTRVELTALVIRPRSRPRLQSGQWSPFEIASAVGGRAERVAGEGWVLYLNPGADSRGSVRPVNLLADKLARRLGWTHGDGHMLRGTAVILGGTAAAPESVPDHLVELAESLRKARR